MSRVVDTSLTPALIQSRSDIAVSLQGPCVDDLRHHFIDRWNFIYDEKYDVRKDVRYSRLPDIYGHPPGPQAGVAQRPEPQYHLQPPPTGQNFPPPPGSQPYTPPAWQSTSRPHTPNTLSTPSSQPSQPTNYQGAYGVPPVASPSVPQNFPPPPPGPPPPSAQPPTQPYGEYQHSSTHSLTQAPPSTYSDYQSQHTTYTPYDGSSELPAQPAGSPAYHSQTYQPPPTEQTRGFDDYAGESYDRGLGDERGLRGRVDQYRQQGKLFGQELSSIGNLVTTGVESRVHQLGGKYFGGTDSSGRPYNQPRGVMTCQILRSCSKWSNGTPTEQSIQNAYIDVIQNSQHFVYIENQFFITATGDQQKPVKNLIGKALVDRILRAARNGERYKVIVVIPAVPAFAGDLRDDSSLGTRAIMEFQYFSINRGGHSIMEKIASAGYNPMDYIRFYNLRNYDRINTGRPMRQAEQESGIRYEDARKQHDDALGAGYGGYGENTGVSYPGQASQYQQYQAAAQHASSSMNGRWDSVAECYMLGGQDIRSVPWGGPAEAELDAFVSEELYIHSKVCMLLFIFCA